MTFKNKYNASKIYTPGNFIVTAEIGLLYYGKYNHVL